ncbi:MAG: glycosyltransferase family 39 protein [bacterium]|nr:glycosyltransferase family 39 protein [bacterium]
MLSRFKSIYFCLFTILIVGLYLIMRLGWHETIEFGYDQPRLAFVIQDFMRSGNYINSQSYSLESPWGNYSWGPALVYFYLPFFYISSDPIMISQLVAIFNVLSILITIYIGKRYFSPVAGLIAGLFLATHPWWEIFSRMIYQPTPVPTFVALMILALFFFLEKPKSYAASAILLLWGLLFQLYISCIYIIAPAGIVFLSQFRKGIFNKYTAFGIILMGIIFIPSIYYYSGNSRMLQAFAAVPDKFEGEKKLIYQRSFEVIKAYFDIVPGGGFNWQLGYANDIFMGSLPYVVSIQITIRIFIVVVLLYSGIVLFKKNLTRKVYRLFLLICTVGPLWFMTFVQVPDLLPRYFILLLPALALLVGITIDDWMRFIRNRQWKIASLIPLIIPIALSTWWVIFIVKYFTFIGSYDYPLGPLSNFSDIPYTFLDNALNWIKADADIKGYKEYIVSTDSTKPTEPALHTASAYYWEYMLKRVIRPAGSSGKYYLLHSTSQRPLTEGASARFGPYVVYEYIKK